MTFIRGLLRRSKAPDDGRLGGLGLPPELAPGFTKERPPESEDDPAPDCPASRIPEPVPLVDPRLE